MDQQFGHHEEITQYDNSMLPLQKQMLIAFSKKCIAFYKYEKMITATMFLVFNISVLKKVYLGADNQATIVLLIVQYEKHRILSTQLEPVQNQHPSD